MDKELPNKADHEDVRLVIFFGGSSLLMFPF